MGSMVQIACRSKSLGGEAPITENRINLIFDSVHNKLRETRKTPEEISGMTTHQDKTLEEMHKKVREASKKERGRTKLSQLNLSNFEIRDFVLLAHPDQKPGKEQKWIVQKRPAVRSFRRGSQSLSESNESPGPTLMY